MPINKNLLPTNKIVGKVEKTEESPLQKILNVIQTPLYATAGIVKEAQRRNKGFIKKSYLNAAISGVKNHTTYGDIVDNKLLAFGLDIFGDPVTYIPAGVLTKGGKWAIKGLAKPAGKLGARLAYGIEKTTGIRVAEKAIKAQEWLGEAFIAKYKLKSVHGPEFADLYRKYLSGIENAAEPGAEIVKTLTNMVPSNARLGHIGMLLEKRPIGSKEQLAKIFTEVPEARAWAREVAQLAPNEKKAYRYALKMLNELEQDKIAMGFLSAEHAKNFIDFHGIQYVPHYAFTKKYFVDIGDKLINTFKLDPALAAIKAKELNIKSGDELIKILEAKTAESRTIGEVLNNDLRDYIKKQLSFTHSRKEAGTTLELSDELETNIARILGIQATEIERAKVALKYQQSMLESLEKKGLVISPELVEDQVKLFGHLRKVDPERANKLMRAGFESLDDMGDAFKGKMVPKTIVNEIKTVMKAYKDPKVMKDFLDHYRDVQNIWKAWTLSIFPAYHSRNAISNLWNNFLAGMGPGAVKHYREAMRLMMKVKRVGFDGLNDTEKKIWSEIKEHRIAGTGWLGGEVGEALEHAASSPEKWFFRLFDPARSKAVQTGYKFGTMIEDHARISHYLWARNGKGLSAIDAAKSVNKFLFDYKYGLSAFEKKYFRDLLLPFYSWTRFNLPLQLEMLAAKPGKFAIIPKATRLAESMLGGPDPDEKFMADWMKRSIKVRVKYDKATGTYQYFMLGSWLPAADINKALSITEAREALLGLWSPLSKLPIEIMFNYNFFRKKAIRDFKGQKVRFLGSPVSPEVAHIGHAIRAFNDIDYFVDAYFVKSGMTTKGAAWARIITGKVYPYKVKDQKKWWEWNMNKRKWILNTLKRRSEKRKEPYNVKQIDKLLANLEATKDFYKNR